MEGMEEEIPSCPLCMEELDATDISVKACHCGYQVCLWCLHHIREQLNGKCPACRTPYKEDKFVFDEVDREEAARAARERAEAKRERQKQERMRELEKRQAAAHAITRQKAKHSLKLVRIVQRNMVYVIGLSLTLAREETLRRPELFGRFGRIMLVLVNRAHPYNSDAPGGPSISAYIQFARDSDATVAARTMNNEILDGREIRTAIATTKYCDAYANTGVPTLCDNPGCLYLHDAAFSDDVFTREDFLNRGLGPPPPSHLFANSNRRIRTGSTSDIPLVAQSSDKANPVQSPVGYSTSSSPRSVPDGPVSALASPPNDMGWCGAPAQDARPPGFDLGRPAVAPPPGFPAKSNLAKTANGNAADSWNEPSVASARTAVPASPEEPRKPKIRPPETKESLESAVKLLAEILARLGESLGMRGAAVPQQESMSMPTESRFLFARHGEGAESTPQGDYGSRASEVPSLDQYGWSASNQPTTRPSPAQGSMPPGF